MKRPSPAQCPSWLPEAPMPASIASAALTGSQALPEGWIGIDGEIRIKDGRCPEHGCPLIDLGVDPMTGRTLVICPECDFELDVNVQGRVHRAVLRFAGK